MSYETMTSRLVGWMNRLPKSEAYNMINEAWTDVRKNRLWSFQLVQDSFSTFNVLNQGTFTCTIGTNTVLGDATATSTLNPMPPGYPFLTQLQFRITSGGIYNIVGSQIVGGFIQLTLDRPFTDPSGSGQSYQVYQAYVVAPVADFKRWLDWSDLTNGFWLSVYMTRREANFGDPQRLYFTFPAFVMPFGPDLRVNAATGTPYATYGYPMYELYPNPLSQVSYLRYWLRHGADLVNPSDTLPYPIPDDLVFHRARMLACEWSESNRDPSIPRGQGAQYQFLYKAAQEKYIELLRQTGQVDRDIVDLYLTRLPGRGSESVGKLPYYSTIAGRAYAGS